MPRKKTAPVLFLLLSIAVLTNAGSVQAKHSQPEQTKSFIEPKPLLADDKRHLSEDNFVIVKTVKALPQLVQNKLLGLGVRSGMADAGQPYETSDMVGPVPLPFRRLIYAGTSDGYCFVYNEYGGYGTGQNVSLYRLMPTQAVLAWQGTLRSDGKYLSLPELRQAVDKVKIYSSQVPGRPQSH